jgi:ribokinase
VSKIVVIGSSNTDMVVKTARFPRPGETIIGGEFFLFAGGKGANQAVAAARMGGQVVFVCKVGDDLFGKQALEGFKIEGIDTDFAAVDPVRASGTALITVDEKGENSIVVAPGANDALDNHDIDKATSALRTAEIVLLQLEIPLPAVEHAAHRAFEMGKKVVLNPAPARVLPSTLYPCLYAITPNETEAQLLTGVEVTDEASARSAAEVLYERGVQHVVITLGAKGAYYFDGKNGMMVPAPVVKAVDTTAAGDVFNGALAVGLAGGSDWPAALALACRAASISVTRMGAQASAPRWTELD